MSEYKKNRKVNCAITDNTHKMSVNVLCVVALFLTVGIMTIPIVMPGTVVAAENNSSRLAPDYRYPVETSGPGLRLLSLLHDTKAKTFEQGLTNPKDRDNRNYLIRPRSVAFGNSGEIYTLDGARGVVFEMTYRDGVLQESSRLPKDKYSFLSPIDIAVAPDRSVWVTDSRHKAVFIIDADGKRVDTLNGIFERPIGVAYHRETNLMLVTDLAKNTIFEIALNHEIIKTHGVYDSKKDKSTDNPKVDSDSAGNTATERVNVEGPSFIAIGSNGDIYIVEALSGTVAIFSKEWKLLRRLGGFGDGPGSFSKPKGIAVDEAGRVYVADALFDNIQIFDEHDRLLLTLGSNGNAPGQFIQPMGIAIDDSGAIYIADSYNGRVQVFRWENIEK